MAGPSRFVTPAGDFRAIFNGEPKVRVEASPAQTFTMVSHWAQRPVVLVSYVHWGAPGTDAPYGDESVTLERLRPGTESRVAAVLRTKLNYRFISFAGAEVAPLAFLGPANGESPGFGDLVLAPGGIYDVVGLDQSAQSSEDFVASFSTAGFPGVEPAPDYEVATVTGYARTSIFRPPAGAVTVEVNRLGSAALAAAVDSLGSAPAPDCHEDKLLYRVAFRPSPGAAPNFQVVGHECAATVTATEDGRALIARSDAHCQLFAVVAADLPASAAGTLNGDATCREPKKPPDGTVTDGWWPSEGRPPAPLLA